MRKQIEPERKTRRRKTPPIYVINLTRSPDRRAHMVEQFEKLGIRFEFATAVDGRTLEGSDLDLYSREEALRLLNAGVHRELAPCEIATALSHLRIYETMAKKRIDIAVVMEDDVDIDPALPGILEWISRLHAPWEIIWLGHWLTYVEPTFDHTRGVPISWWERKTIGARFRFGRLLDYPFGTHAYVITREGAKKLLQRAYPIRMPADNLLNGCCDNPVINAYAVSPPCVTINERFYWKTTIDTRKDLIAEAWSARETRSTASMKQLGRLGMLYKAAGRIRERLRFFARQANPYSRIHRP